MNTIQYMGSKKKLVNFISDSINHYIESNNIPTNHINTFFDALAGSGRVSYHFKDTYTIISNDKMCFTKVILSAYLNNTFNEKHYQELIDHLNVLALDPCGINFDKTDKWFTKTYGMDWNNGSSIHDDGSRKIWLSKNSKKIDIIRTAIDNLNVSEIERNVLILSLILAINKISNVVGHQNGYLKNWSSNSNNDLLLLNPNIPISNNFNHKHFTSDIFELLPKIESDICYLDIPYGTNNKKVSRTGGCRYDHFYHLWNTIVKNDKPKVWGKASKPMSIKGLTGELELNDNEKVYGLLKKIITLSRSKILVLSYSNKGLLSVDQIVEIFRSSDYDFESLVRYQIGHKINHQSNLVKKSGDFIDRDNEDKKLVEYLFIIKRKENKKKYFIIKRKRSEKKYKS